MGGERQALRLLELWVSGLEVDWSRLHGEAKPSRVSLPVYPFARERYWIETASGVAKGNATAMLHPLLHGNTSDLGEQRYASTFTGHEFFLADHRVLDRHVLPGVAYLEMARAAVLNALPDDRQAPAIELRNIVWAQPVVVSAPAQVNIALIPSDGGAIDYEIYSHDGDVETVHGQGRAVVAPLAAASTLDVEQLERRMTRDTVDAADFYASCARMGLAYGPSLRGVTDIRRGDDELLVRLRMPSAVRDAAAGYVLHPTMMDSAIHACAALLDGIADEPRVPFALDALRIVGPCVAEMLAWVRVAPGGRKIDIDLCEASGNVRVQFLGLSSRVMGSIAAAEQTVEFKDGGEPLLIVEADLAETPAGSIVDYLRNELSGLLKLPASKLDPQAALEKYGIDSILALRLTNHLEKTFGSLSKTLFYEYQTLAALAGYFEKEHAAVVRELVGAKAATPAAPVAMTPIQTPAPMRRGRRRFSGTRAAGDREIAIVGLAGRYPQAENLQEFWRNLQDGRDCITEIPSERWDHRRYFDPPSEPGGQELQQVGRISRRHRPVRSALLQHFAEGSGHHRPAGTAVSRDRLADHRGRRLQQESIAGGKVGVYVGVMWGQYELFGAESMLRGKTALSSSSYASIANRVSYFFDLHGPSMALDTMCSSSLTAIHLACEALQKGEIEAAIAGGVNLSLHPYKYVSLSQGQFVASDGRCRSFGEGGDGYVPGEGVGAVLLKPLDAALRDGDQIYAVVKSSALNHGGKTNGYSVPNPNAQTDLIRAALDKARIDPATLSYIETHGTAPPSAIRSRSPVCPRLSPGPRPARRLVPSAR